MAPEARTHGDDEEESDDASDSHADGATTELDRMLWMSAESTEKSAGISTFAQTVSTTGIANQDKQRRLQEKSTQHSKHYKHMMTAVAVAVAVALAVAVAAVSPHRQFQCHHYRPKRNQSPR